MGGSQDLVRTRAASSRHAHTAPHHGIDPRKVREADAKRMARIGWLVAGGFTLLTGFVLMFVMNTHDTRKGLEEERERKLREYLDPIENPDIKPGRRRWVIPPEVNAALATLIKTRNLKEKLAIIEAHLAVSPTRENLARDLAEVRSPDLMMEAHDAAGDLNARFDNVAKQVAQKYIEVLRTAASAAASATAGEGLEPYDPLEDTICTMLHEAMAKNDAESQAIYQPMWTQTCSEINGIVAKLFNDAYQNRVPWKDLLADTAGWTIASSRFFKHTFGAGLTLVNGLREQSGSGELSYAPANTWRDYVLDVEFELDSGTLVFCTRIDDKMDPQEVPAFSVGTKNSTIQIEYGKTYTLVISTIGNQLTVTGEGISHTEEIESTKSRKGEPGILAQPGTTATITKLRARYLR